MPGGDRTGPSGLGPMTGRAAGYCAGNSDISYETPPSARSNGVGYGRYQGLYFRRGYRGRWAAPNADHENGSPPSPDYDSTQSRQRELEFLECQAEYFKDKLQGIKQRIEKLSAEKAKGRRK